MSNSENDERIRDLLPGIGDLPEDTWPTPIPARAADASAEVHAEARANDEIIVDHETGSMTIYPGFENPVDDDRFCTRLEDANITAGYRRHHWWNVEHVRGRIN